MNESLSVHDSCKYQTFDAGQRLKPETKTTGSVCRTTMNDLLSVHDSCKYQTFDTKTDLKRWPEAQIRDQNSRGIGICYPDSRVNEFIIICSLNEVFAIRLVEL